MKLTLKEINKAKQYLSNVGYGTGSNFTVNSVANLMAEWAIKEQLFKKDIELQTLKDTQMLFKIQSDLSCDTNGYRRLNERIEQLTKQNES